MKRVVVIDFNFIKKEYVNFKDLEADQSFVLKYHSTPPRLIKLPFIISLNGIDYNAVSTFGNLEQISDAVEVTRLEFRGLSQSLPPL